MVTTRPRYSKEEYAPRGDSRYERDVCPNLVASDDGKFVVDIETGAYEIDADERAALDRLIRRVPTAQPWLRRVGSRHARHIGARPQPCQS